MRAKRTSAFVNATITIVFSQRILACPVRPLLSKPSGLLIRAVTVTVWPVVVEPVAEVLVDVSAAG